MVTRKIIAAAGLAIAQAKSTWDIPSFCSASEDCKFLRHTNISANNSTNIPTYQGIDADAVHTYLQNFVPTISKQYDLQPVTDLKPTQFCQVGLGPNSVDLFESLFMMYPYSIWYLFEPRLPAEYFDSIPDEERIRLGFRTIGQFGKGDGSEDDEMLASEMCEVIIWSIDVQHFSLQRMKPLFDTNEFPVVLYNMRGCTPDSFEGNPHPHECRLMLNLFSGTICGMISDDGFTELQLPNGTIERWEMPHTRNQCAEEVCACITTQTALADTIHIELCNDPELNFTSQWAQDAFVLKNFVEFDDPRKDGIYVDIGAFDPFLLSSTAHFDQCLGWKGLCIEPNPRAQVSMKAYRSCEVLPYCVRFQISKF